MTVERLMNVLIISSIPIFPISGGNRARIHRLANSIKSLGHSVSFAYLPSRKVPIDVVAHEKYLDGGRFYFLKNAGVFGRLEMYFRNKLTSIVRNRLHRLGFKGFYYTDLDALFHSSWIEQISNITHGVDVVVVEYVFNSKAFESVPQGVKKILDTHDSFSNRHETYFNQGLKSGYWISLKPEDEIRGFCRADVVVAIQQAEAAMFRSRLSNASSGCDAKVVTVSHSLDTSHPLSDYSTNNVAMFLGSNNTSNRQAVEYLIDKIVPLISKKLPEFKLLVVGEVGKYFGANENVEIIGYVDDVFKLYCQAPISLNPMLSGTGIAIKLLEAMASGLPVVSTETGARGLPDDYRNGVICFGDEDCNGFAQATIELLRSEERRKKIGRRGYEDALRWNAEQIDALANCF